MSLRMERINAEMQKVLSQIINDELRNPNLDDCVITIAEVKTSPDLSTAKVFVSALNGEDKQELLLLELERSANFIRKRIAEKLDFKRTPKLYFEYDNSLVQGENIMKILESLKTGDKN